MLYSLLTNSGVEVIGGLLFFVSAIFLIKDKLLCEQASMGKRKVLLLLTGTVDVILSGPCLKRGILNSQRYPLNLGLCGNDLDNFSFLKRSKILYKSIFR